MPDPATNADLERRNLVYRGDPAPRGRPKSLTPKAQVTVRLDADVLAHFKSTGKGWQTRLNTMLREAIA